MKQALPILVVVAATLAGCADNAIAELTLDLPVRSGEVRWAYVQARSGTRDFDDEWAGDDPLAGLALEDSRRTVVVSVEADDGEELDRPLLVKIRYCRSPRCDDPTDGGAQQVRITVERAFYRGHFTEIRLPEGLPAVCDPPCAPTTYTVTKCEVKGCRQGVTTRYCDDEGRHYCE